jgi:hypothetical protein
MQEEWKMKSVSWKCVANSVVTLKVVTLKKFNLSRLVIQCAVLLFLPLYAVAQQATIVGTATDPTGAVVANVTIVATSNETGQSHTITTNETGQYVVPDLQIGHYNFKATASGFKVAEQRTSYSTWVIVCAWTLRW